MLCAAFGFVSAVTVIGTSVKLSASTAVRIRFLFCDVKGISNNILLSSDVPLLVMRDISKRKSVG
jgi:hypothetical protein